MDCLAAKGISASYAPKVELIVKADLSPILHAVPAIGIQADEGVLRIGANVAGLAARAN